MLKLNLTKLFANLDKADSNKETSNVQIADYLNELLTRLLSDNPIWLSDIDFDAFTMEELEEFETYIRRLEKMIDESCRIKRAITSAKTQALSAPAFC